MKTKVHQVSVSPKIDHDLAGDHLHIFLLNFASGIVELPSSVGFDRVLGFKKVHPGAGEIIVMPKADQTVDGEGSVVLSKQHQTVVIASADENGWLVASAFAANSEGAN